MAIEWSDAAIDAVARIGTRIESFAGADSAADWRKRLSDRVELAELLPFASRVVPEFGVETFREVFENDYRILFRIVPGGIEIATIFHGSMRLDQA